MSPNYNFCTGSNDFPHGKILYCLTIWYFKTSDIDYFQYKTHENTQTDNERKMLMF